MLLFFFLTTIIVTKTAQAFDNPIMTNQVHPLRLECGAGGSSIKGVSRCLSWRFGVETNNVIGWKTIPEECVCYVGRYMLGHQYRLDSAIVTKEALLYAQTLCNKFRKNVWIFDIDETALSNLQYYAKYGFGVELFNATLFNAWVQTGTAQALPETLKLYKKIKCMGFKIVFLSERTPDQRKISEINLKCAGYRSWEKLLLKGSDYKGKTVSEYKSAQRKKLVEAGYRIVGNIGDQWSDITGTNAGDRTFKLPDPMYYIS